MKYKYEQNKVIGLPEMKEPKKILAPEWGWSDKEKDIYYGQLHEYIRHIKSLPSFDIVGDIPKDWPEVLEEGVHFKIGRGKQIDFCCDQQQWQEMTTGEKNKYFQRVAVPIQSIKEPEQDELWNELIRLFNETLQFEQLDKYYLLGIIKQFTITKNKP